MSARAASATLGSVAIALLLAAACQPPPPRVDARCPPVSAPTCDSKRTSDMYTASRGSAEVSHIPDPPVLPPRPLHPDGAFSVWGAQRRFRAQTASEPDADGTMNVVGYVVKTNFRDAPACALIPLGKRLPADCRPPIPTLWLGDTADQAEGLLPVKGFASSFASLLPALKAERARPPAPPLIDDLWGRPIPRPLPARGAKMRVTGVMGKIFTLSSESIDLEPSGVLTYTKGEYLELPPEPASLGK